MRMTITILTLAAVAFLAGCSTPSLQVHGIPNFREVAPGIDRGGQPTATSASDDGWWYIKNIRHDRWVLKLNKYSEGDDTEAAIAGLHIVSDPISFWRQIIGPTDAQVQEAVDVMADSTAGDGVFVHCSHGQDRTGLIVAVYRVRVQHWSKADAEKEMLAGGFHKSLIGLWWYWNYKVK